MTQSSQRKVYFTNTLFCKEDNKDVAERKCLCCQQKFESVFKGNRICDKCKNSEAYKGL